MSEEKETDVKEASTSHLDTTATERKVSGEIGHYYFSEDINMEPYTDAYKCEATSNEQETMASQEETTSASTQTSGSFANQSETQVSQKHQLVRDGDKSMNPNKRQLAEEHTGSDVIIDGIKLQDLANALIPNQMYAANNQQKTKSGPGVNQTVDAFKSVSSNPVGDETQDYTTHKLDGGYQEPDDDLPSNPMCGTAIRQQESDVYENDSSPPGGKARGPQEPQNEIPANIIYGSRRELFHHEADVYENASSPPVVTEAPTDTSEEYDDGGKASGPHEPREGCPQNLMYGTDVSHQEADVYENDASPSVNPGDQRKLKAKKDGDIYELGRKQNHNTNGHTDESYIDVTKRDAEGDNRHDDAYDYTDIEPYAVAHDGENETSLDNTTTGEPQSKLSPGNTTTGVRKPRHSPKDLQSNPRHAASNNQQVAEGRSAVYWCHSLLVVVASLGLIALIITGILIGVYYNKQEQEIQTHSRTEVASYLTSLPITEPTGKTAVVLSDWDKVNPAILETTDDTNTAILGTTDATNLPILDGSTDGTNTPILESTHTKPPPILGSVSGANPPILGTTDGTNPPILGRNDGTSPHILGSADETNRHTTRSTGRTTPHTLMGSYESDCSDYYASGRTTSGVYKLGSLPLDVQAYCDMHTAGGGWTVIQLRHDGSVSFNRKWNEYKHGFGNKNGEYWLGNENIHLLTNQKNYKLRVDLEDWNGNKRYAEYTSFRVSSESDGYRLQLSGYRGDAGDSMTASYSNNGQRFSTVDRDNDKDHITHCSKRFGQGGWWFTYGCGYSYLNGCYLGNCGKYCQYQQGVLWKRWRRNEIDYSLKSVSMKIRPN